MIRIAPQSPSPQAQWPPPSPRPHAEAALAAWSAPTAEAAGPDAPTGRPAQSAWPDEDYRGWAGL